MNYFWLFIYEYLAIIIILIYNNLIMTSLRQDLVGV